MFGDNETSWRWRWKCPACDFVVQGEGPGASAKAAEDVIREHRTRHRTLVDSQPVTGRVGVLTERSLR
jgi:hypothetical protein